MEAYQFCEESGASLLYVNSAEAQKVVNSFIKEKTDDKDDYIGVWMDLTDRESDDLRIGLQIFYKNIKSHYELI